MNNFGLNYDKILEILKSITKEESFIIQIREPKLKDIELIAMNLTSEYMRIDSECQLFRIIPEVARLNVLYIIEESENYSPLWNLLDRNYLKSLMALKIIILWTVCH